jgi:DNA-binding response OmpR family regulator
MTSSTTLPPITADQKTHASGTLAVPGSLTRREAQLLAVLQQNPGKCFSRPYLLQTIWGYQAGAKTRTVDVHIRRIRAKLGPEGREHIKTILRTGYFWQP